MGAFISPARVLGSRNHRYPGKLFVEETFLEVPLQYEGDTSRKLKLFLRTVERYQKSVDPSQKPRDSDRPLFLYLQGGPGFPCRTPTDIGWLHPVLDKGYKVVLMDQRGMANARQTLHVILNIHIGTGMSSTISARTLTSEGSSQQQAEYLKNFRADNIVRDCEAVRKTLTKEYPSEKKKWTIMGQSFGGFCAVHYICKHPEGLEEVFITGGLPPLVKNPYAVYSKLFEKVSKRNEMFYQRYPEDIDRVHNIVAHLHKEAVTLPSGGKLSVLRFRLLGRIFGFHGQLERLHELITRMTSDLSQFGFLTRQTLSEFEQLDPFDSAPLYALLHEACYAQKSATRWSADRVRSNLPQFGLPPKGAPIFFFGEMVLRDTLTNYSELTELLDVADILATFEDWPELYDEVALKKNEVPVYSAVYVEDMYVHFDFSQETASKIRCCRTFITNAFYHDALGKKAAELMKTLFDMRDDMLD